MGRRIFHIIGEKKTTIQLSTQRSAGGAEGGEKKKRSIRNVICALRRREEEERFFHEDGRIGWGGERECFFVDIYRRERRGGEKTGC